MDSFPRPESAIAKKRRRATQKAPDGQARRPSAFPRSYWLVVLLGIIPSVLALAHTPGVNGPYYWKWGYHDGPFAAYAGLALVAAGILYWVHDQAESDRSMRKALIAATAVHLLLTFGYIGFAPDSFGNIAGRVEHPDINSYHSEAQRTGDLGEWLETFPERVPDFLLHAKTHPPGPILYYVFWNGVLGPASGAPAGGVLLGLLGALTVPLLFLLVREVSGSSKAALTAAALWAVLPGPILMLTSFDAVYPAATVGMMLLWLSALRGSWRSALGCGTVLFFSLLFAHNFLVLGAWFVLMTAWSVLSDPDRGQAGRRALSAVVAGSIPLLAGFGLLYTAFGYNHPAALRAAIEIQDVLAGQLQPPYAYTIFWDLYDFFLAGGWLTFGLLAVFCANWRRNPEIVRGFAACCLGTLASVNLSGLLAAEAARVWLFLQPLAVALAAIELGRRSLEVRMAVSAAMLFALAAIRASMSFI